MTDQRNNWKDIGQPMPVLDSDPAGSPSSNSPHSATQTLPSTQSAPAPQQDHSKTQPNEASNLDAAAQAQRDQDQASTEPNEAKQSQTDTRTAGEPTPAASMPTQEESVPEQETNGKRFVEIVEREKRAEYIKGKEVGRKLGHEEGYRAGYHSGYFHGDKDNYKKTTEQRIEEAIKQGKAEGIRMETENWMKNQIPILQKAHVKVVRQLREADAEKHTSEINRLHAQHADDTEKLRTQLEQDFQRRQRESRLDLLALGYHKGATTQILKQLGHDHLVYSQDHEDYQAPLIGSRFADIMFREVDNKTWAQSPWRVAVDKKSPLSLVGPAGIDLSNTQSKYFQLTKSAFFAQGYKHVEARVHAAQAKQKADAEAAAEKARVERSKQQAFANQPNRKRPILKERKPRRVHQASPPPLEYNDEEDYDEEGYYPDFDEDPGSPEEDPGFPVPRGRCRGSRCGRIHRTIIQ